MRLLVAEDDPKLLKSLVHIFESNKFSVDGVTNGGDALTYARSMEYDGLVLDIMMPGLDGIRVLQTLRREGITTPTLFSGSEIGFTTDAGTKAAEAILAKVDHLTDVQTQARPDGLTEVRLKTDSKDIYAVSRQIFFAFAEEDQPLLELNLKKASLEDIFLELTEHSDGQAQDGADAPEEKEDEAK